jgi:hypothetical protein
MRQLATTTLALVGLAAMGAVPARCEVLRVPQDHATVQAAVDASSDGDVIRISKGVHTEQVVIAGKTDLTLQGKGKAIIDGGGVGPAIVVMDSTRVTIQKLVVAGGTEWTLHLLRSTDCVVTKCTVERAANRALVVAAGSGHVITKNRFSENAGANVDLDSDNNVNPTGCSVSKNRISGGFVGVEVQGRGHRIEKNRVQGTTGFGLQTFQADDVLFTKNRLSKLAGEGACIRGVDVRLVKNTFAGTRGDGIHIVTGATQILIESNTIKNALGESADGIDTDDPVDNITVRKNKVIKTEDDGIDMAVTNSLVEGNTVIRSGDDAFRVGPETLSSEFVGNRSKKSGGDGLRDLTDGEPSNTFRGNRFDTINRD